MLHCFLTSFGSGQATQSGAREPYHKRDRKEMIEKKIMGKRTCAFVKKDPRDFATIGGRQKAKMVPDLIWPLTRLDPKKFGPYEIWDSRNLGLKNLVPKKYWPREIWSPNKNDFH